MPELSSPFAGRPLSRDDAERLADALRVLADPRRLQILSLLHRDPGLCNGDLVRPVGLSQPTISHHVKILADAGLVEYGPGRRIDGAPGFPPRPLRLVPKAVNAIAGLLAAPVGRRR